MQEEIGDQELKFLHRFCDHFAPETQGQDLVTRIDRVENKFKNLLLGVEMLHNKYRQDFK